MNKLLYYLIGFTLVMNGTMVCMSPEQKAALKTKLEQKMAAGPGNVAATGMEGAETPYLAAYPMFKGVNYMHVKTYALDGFSDTLEQTAYGKSLLDAINQAATFKDKWSFNRPELYNFILKQPGIKKELSQPNKIRKIIIALGLNKKDSLEHTIAKTLKSVQGKPHPVLGTIDRVSFDARPLEEAVIRRNLEIDPALQQEYKKIRRTAAVCGGAVLVGGAYIALKLFNAHQKIAA